MAVITIAITTTTTITIAATIFFAWADSTPPLPPRACKNARASRGLYVPATGSIRVAGHRVNPCLA
eukprot:10920768-Lingulodinium_polyedra.AAC.1